MQGELKGKVTNMKSKRSIKAMINGWADLQGDEDHAYYIVQALTWALDEERNETNLVNDLATCQTLRRRATRESYWWPVSWHSPIVKTRWDR